VRFRGLIGHDWLPPASATILIGGGEDGATRCNTARGTVSFGPKVCMRAILQHQQLIDAFVPDRPMRDPR